MKQLSIYENEYLNELDLAYEETSLNVATLSSSNNALSGHTLSLNHSSAEPRIDNLRANNVRTNNNNLRAISQNNYTHEGNSAQAAPKEHNAYPANVTEIVLAKDKIDSIQLILPMLINLHQEQRWLAWIDPPIQLLKEWQKTHQESALNDIMILRSNDNLSVFELSKRALEAGTCHAVIAWTNSLSHDEFARLETASSKGNSHGIILKSRQGLN